MTRPTLEQAAAAIDKLSGMGGQIGAAASLVGIVVDLFDEPRDQDTLKAAYKAARLRTDSALDRLDAAIDEAERRG